MLYLQGKPKKKPSKTPVSTPAAISKAKVKANIATKDSRGSKSITVEESQNPVENEVSKPDSTEAIAESGEVSTSQQSIEVNCSP